LSPGSPDHQRTAAAPTQQWSLTVLLVFTLGARKQLWGLPSAGPLSVIKKGNERITVTVHVEECAETKLRCVAQHFATLLISCRFRLVLHDPVTKGSFIFRVGLDVGLVEVNFKEKWFTIWVLCTSRCPLMA
jgi:hypothetical protein